MNKLFLGNLPWSITEENLREEFGRFGEISELRLIKDRDTGRPKGFGFITYVKQAASEKAILEMNNTQLGGRNIIVNKALDKPQGSRERIGGPSRRRF